LNESVKAGEKLNVFATGPSACYGRRTVGARKPDQVVAIGASAGGLEALRPLLARFTYDHAAFVIVTHLSRGWKSALAELLQRHTIMEMHKVTQSATMLANHAYVMGEGIELTADGETLRCHERPEGAGGRPIDRLFGSLAHSWRHRAIGVILSGSGSDGSAGLQAMHQHGGRTFVQEPASALFDGMPSNALKFADVCLEPDALGDEIMRSLKNFELSVRATASRG
jgi:two-component system CheB/CheR fusion protein